jgi:hypothetical protein
MADEIAKDLVPVLQQENLLQPNPGAGDKTFEEYIKDKASKASEDKAMKGGIDFTANRTPLEIKNGGLAIKFHINPAQLAQLEHAPGLSPVIIGIRPMKDLKAFLGVP